METCLKWLLVNCQNPWHLKSCDTVHMHVYNRPSSCISNPKFGPKMFHKFQKKNVAHLFLLLHPNLVFLGGQKKAQKKILTLPTPETETPRCRKTKAQVPQSRSRALHGFQIAPRQGIFGGIPLQCRGSREGIGIPLFARIGLYAICMEHLQNNKVGCFFQAWMIIQMGNDKTKQLANQLTKWCLEEDPLLFLGEYARIHFFRD